MMTTMAQILPQNPEAAIRKLLEITLKLTSLMEDESRSVTLNDTVLFLSTNKEKQKLVDLYQRGATEFRIRVEEFRTADKALIDQLEDAQKKLGELTKANMHTLETASIANA
jgi:hypothetical protein